MEFRKKQTNKHYIRFFLAYFYQLRNYEHHQVKCHATIKSERENKITMEKKVALVHFQKSIAMKVLYIDTH